MDRTTRKKLMRITAYIIWVSCLWIFSSVVYQTFANDATILDGVIAGLDWLVFFIVLTVSVIGAMNLWEEGR